MDLLGLSLFRLISLLHSCHIRQLSEKYLLKTYYLPGTGDTAVNKTDTVLSYYSSERKDNNKNNSVKHVCLIVINAIKESRKDEGVLGVGLSCYPGGQGRPHKGDVSVKTERREGVCHPTIWEKSIF